MERKPDKLLDYLSEIHDNISNYSKICVGKITEKQTEWNSFKLYAVAVLNTVAANPDNKFKINVLKTLEIALRLNGHKDEQSPLKDIYQQALTEYKILKDVFNKQRESNDNNTTN